MTYKFVYDVPYVKVLLKYLLIPVLAILLVGLIILYRINKKYKDHNDPNYKYKLNMISLYISIAITAFFLAILIGFALALRLQMKALNFNSVICFCVMLAPIFPCIYLIYLLVKLIKLIKNKPKAKKKKAIETSPEDVEILSSDTDIETNNVKNENEDIDIIDARESDLITEEKEENIKKKETPTIVIDESTSDGVSEMLSDEEGSENEKQ